MSLVYGVVYIGQFQSLKGVEKGLGWIFVSGSHVARDRDWLTWFSKAAGQTSTAPYWNMWLFLAMPAVWLAWSLLFFCGGLLCFIWRSGDRRPLVLAPFTDDTAGLPMSSHHFTPLWPRLILTSIFAIGLGMVPLVWSKFRLDSASNEWEDSEDEEDEEETTRAIGAKEGKDNTTQDIGGSKDALNR
jgi:hypothetical protein